MQEQETLVKEAKATLKFARISSRKVKIVADLIRGKNVDEALAIVKFTPKASSEIIENDYQILLLVSDGVTDMITDKKIKELIKKSKSEELLSNIINEAVNVDQNLSVPKKLEKKALSTYIVPFKGRDNATGAIYIKDE